LYLIDSFSGFSDKDISYERENYIDNVFCKKGLYANTSIELVKSRLLNPDNAAIIKGYVPDAIKDIDDRFCFVNLDMDMYLPMFEALKKFWPMMSYGGVLLLHDYFNLLCPGVAKAVEDYEKLIHKKMYKMSIGDYCSLALVKM